jgi:glucose dehydrogenase
MADKNMLCCIKEPLHRSSVKPSSVHSGVVLALLLVGGTVPVEAATSGAAAGGEWTTAGGTAQDTRYSELKDINVGNVKSLKEEFSLRNR